jgi:hypothetical protein
MGYRRLFVLVEGNDDERFCSTILQPVFTARYDDVRFWQYSQERNDRIAGFLKSIGGMGADYLYLADADYCPCPSEKKNQLLEQFPRQLSTERIVVVVREIEGWYLAGLEDQRAEALKISARQSTNQLTKEQFNQLIPARFGGSRVDFLIELLKDYSLSLARQRNQSLDYLIKRFGEG